MKRIDIRVLIGVLLIGAGFLFLLQTFNILSNVWIILWTVAFLVGSGIFLYIYINDRRQWWALIPTMTLLGLAGTIFVDTYLPDLSNLGSALLVSGIGLGFWVIYLTNRDFWWAIIPGGVLITLGAVTLTEDLIAADSEGGVFFIGMAITFLLVALLAKPRESFWWAYIPASVFLVVSVFLIGSLMHLFKYIWPVAIILIGVILLIKNIRRG